MGWNGEERRSINITEAHIHMLRMDSIIKRMEKDMADVKECQFEINKFIKEQEEKQNG